MFEIRSMAMVKLKRREPDSSNYHLEKVQPDSYVTSFREGAKTVWITLVICLLFTITLMLTIAIITKSEWQPYVPMFFKWLIEVFGALKQLVK